jgi:hypothetical protein
MAVVGFFAYQASANTPDSLASPQPSASVTPSAHPSGTQNKPGPPAPPTLPPHSGTGSRLVYSLSLKRVWLVDGSRTQTFAVMPSPVDPKPGAYRVSSRAVSVDGSDGVPVEHVVRFTIVGGVTVGFSAARDNSMASPDPDLKTGGIRMKRSNADAMWALAIIGTKVVVVP